MAQEGRLRGAGNSRGQPPGLPCEAATPIICPSGASWASGREEVRSVAPSRRCVAATRRPPAEGGAAAAQREAESAGARASGARA